MTVNFNLNYVLNMHDRSKYINAIERDGISEDLAYKYSFVRVNKSDIKTITKLSKTIFTIFQTESKDNGKTWTKPKQILEQQGGAPAHLFRHSSGMLVCTYGYRQTPFGIKVMFSKDEGKTWDTDNDLYINHVSDDIGYPSTIELKDGGLLTVFYARTAEDKPCTIVQQKWSFEND